MLLIQLFAKAPQLGYVKKRLEAQYTAEQALAIYEILLGEMLQRLVTIAERGHIAVEVWSTHASEFTRPAYASHVPLRQQIAGDLGVRLSHSMREGFRDHEAVLVVGADCLGADLDYLLMALSKLECSDTDAVFGPAEDGGYVLLGLKRYEPSLFDSIHWGGDQVLQQSVQHAEKAGLNVELLTPSWDIDTPEDVQRLLKSGSLSSERQLALQQLLEEGPSAHV